MARRPGRPHKGWKAAARWARRKVNPPTPPVPLPVYPFTSHGMCLLCWQMVHLTHPVFPSKDGR